MLFVIYLFVITVMFCFPNLTIKVWSKNKEKTGEVLIKLLK